MGDYLKRTVSDKIRLVKDNTTCDTNEETILTRRQQNKIDTANRKWKTIQEAQELFKAGNSKSFIAKKLGITRVTLNKYLKLNEPPVIDSNCIIDDYIPLIKEMIINKKKTREIYQAMRDAGYKGKMTVLNMHMKSIRQEVKNNTTYLKRSKLKKLFYRDLESMKNEDLKNDITYYLNQNQELANLIAIAKEFKVVLFSKKPEQLDVWIDKAKQLNIDELNSFIKLFNSSIFNCFALSIQTSNCSGFFENKTTLNSFTSAIRLDNS